MSNPQCHRRILARAALFTASLAALPTGSGCRLYRPAGPLFPDTATRAKVSGLHASDVRQMKFWGPSMRNHIWNPIVVTDSRLINRFLSALRGARSGPPTADRADRLVIELNDRGAVHRDDIFLEFLGTDPDRCFGPDFQRALKDLSAVGAARNAAKVGQTAPSARR